MAAPISFISKLFGSRLFKFRRKKKPEAEAKGPRPRPARGNKPLKLAQEQHPAGGQDQEHRPKREAPKAEPVDPYSLSLPVGHVIFELWRACRDQGGSFPRPELSFRTEEPQVFDPKTSMAELTKLLMSVSSSAAARLSAMTPPAAPPPTPEQQLTEGPQDPEPLVPPDLDAQATVFISGDKLSAWLLIYPPSGKGEDVTKGIIMNALGSAGVAFGVDLDTVRAIPEMEAPYFRMHLIARGKAAVPGKDGAVIDLYPREASRELPVDDMNRVDYTALRTTQNVEKGAPICRINPPTPGIAGRTVTDKELPTRDGVPAVAPMGRNTALNEDDSALIATRDGGLEFSGRAFQVNPLLEIDGNVDYSSGSVNFLGDVHIHGDVCSGFTVRAMGTVRVDGVVESSTIEAGGDLILSKGVQGNNQAVIRSHRDIFAKYLENCIVHAKENLNSECIISCEVYCDAGVYVQNGRGAIIGGRIWAGHEVDANIVGSKTEVRTTVVLGGLPCESYEKELLIKEIEELEQRLEETERQPSSPTKLSRMSKMRMQISVDRLKLSQHQKSLDELQDDTERRLAGRLTFRTAHPGTLVEIGGAQLKLENETRHSIATLIDGEVKLIT